MALLAVYSLGLGVLFVMAALFTGGLMKSLKSIGHVSRILQCVAGGTTVLMGIAMMTGQLSAFSYWLLDAFPILGSIG